VKCGEANAFGGEANTAPTPPVHHPPDTPGQLQDELRKRKHDLQAEIQASTRARLHIALLTAQMAIGDAFRAAAAGQPVTEWGDAVDASVAELARCMRRMVQNPAAGSGEHEAIPGAVSDDEDAPSYSGATARGVEAAAADDAPPAAAADDRRGEAAGGASGSWSGEPEEGSGVSGAVGVRTSTFIKR